MEWVGQGGPGPDFSQLAKKGGKSAAGWRRRAPCPQRPPRSLYCTCVCAQNCQRGAAKAPFFGDISGLLPVEQQVAPSDLTVALPFTGDAHVSALPGQALTVMRGPTPSHYGTMVAEPVPPPPPVCVCPSHSLFIPWVRQRHMRLHDHQVVLLN